MPVLPDIKLTVITLTAVLLRKIYFKTMTSQNYLELENALSKQSIVGASQTFCSLYNPLKETKYILSSSLSILYSFMSYGNEDYYRCWFAFLEVLVEHMLEADQY